MKQLNLTKLILTNLNLTYLTSTYRKTLRGTLIGALRYLYLLNATFTYR